MMRILFKILLILSSFYVQLAQSQAFNNMLCLKAIRDLDGVNFDIANAASTEFTYDTIFYEGKSVDVGDYDLCTTSPDLHHCLVGSVVKEDKYTPLPPFTGICIPKSCTSEVLTESHLMNVIKNEISSKRVKSDYRKLSYWTKLENNLLISNITHTGFTCGNNRFIMTPDRYLICLIVICLILIMCISTMIELMRPGIFDETTYYYHTIQRSWFYQICRAFSLIRNIKLLGNYTTNYHDPRNDFRIFDGMRTLSILWIMLGHTLAISTSIGLINPAQVLPPSGIMKHILSQLFLSSRFGVDTFFYISGFLVIKSMLDKLHIPIHSLYSSFTLQTPSNTTLVLPEVQSFLNLKRMNPNERTYGSVSNSEIALQLSPPSPASRRHSAESVITTTGVDTGILPTHDTPLLSATNTTNNTNNTNMNYTNTTTSNMTPQQIQQQQVKNDFINNIYKNRYHAALTNYMWIPYMYIMRYLRIFPAYLICLLIWWKMAVVLGEGPFWYRWHQYTHQCDLYSWTNFIFINNLYPYNSTESSECFYVSWYLAVDFQFYLVSPLFLIAYMKNEYLGIFFTLFMSLLSGILQGYETYLHGDSPNTFDGLWVVNYSHHIYTKPQMRFVPYGMGMLTAMLWYYKMKHYPQYKLSTFLSNLLLILSIIGLLVYIFGSVSAYQHRPCGYLEESNEECGSNWTLTTRVLYNSTTKLGWSLALAIITLLCANRQAKGIYHFLSHSIFYIISKLTFSLYLIHVIVLNVWVFNRTQKYRYSFLEFTMDYMSVVFVSLIMSLFVTVLIENPLSTLTKSVEAYLRRKWS